MVARLLGLIGEFVWAAIDEILTSSRRRRV